MLYEYRERPVCGVATQRCTHAQAVDIAGKTK